MRMRFANAIAFGALLATLAGWQMVYGQSASVREPLNIPVNDNSVVMFFYLPANSYLHPPLIFRVAKAGSPLLNTAPIVNMGGRTPYISIAEMRNLVRLLAQSHLSWRRSERMKSPRVPNFKETTGKLEIRVFSGGRVMLSVSNPGNICRTLAPLEAALKQPRARWEFELFRVDYGCSVPGFNRDAYPQHYEGGG